MKTTAITIIVAGSLLGATAALAQGTNVGAIHTNPGVGAIHANPGAIGTNPGASALTPVLSTQPRCYRQRHCAVSIASAFDGWPGTGLLGARKPIGQRLSETFALNSASQAITGLT